MLFSKNIIQRTAAAACAFVMLFSVGCSNDPEDKTKPIEEITTAESSAVSTSVDYDTTTTEELTTELASTPVAVELDDLDVNIIDGLPEQYQAVLVKYRAMVQAFVNGDVVDNGDGTYSSPHFPYPVMSYSLTEIESEITDPTLSSFGYAVKDINGDGVEELFLMCDNHALLEIYTIVRNEAKFVQFFWPGFTGVITEKGELYTEMLTSSTMMDYYAVETLDPATGIFTAIRRLGHNSTDDPDALYYVESKVDNEEIIDKSEFDSFVASYPSIPQFGESEGAASSALEFIPISTAK